MLQPKPFSYRLMQQCIPLYLELNQLHTNELKNLIETDLSIEQKIKTLIQNLSNGDITIEEMDAQLKQLGIESNISTSENGTKIITFKYNGKEYIISDANGSITSNGNNTDNIDNIINDVFGSNGKNNLSGNTGNDYEEGDPYDGIGREEFETLIESGEFDKFVMGEDALKYINAYMKSVKEDLKAKFNYSDNYIDMLLNFVLSENKITLEDGLSNDFFKTRPQNIKAVLRGLKDSINALTDSPSILSRSYGNKISTSEMDDTIFTCSNSDKIQERFFSKMLTNVVSQLKFNNDKERIAFYNIIFDKIGCEFNERFNGTRYISTDSLSALDKNGDNSWFDELFEIIQTEASKIKHIDQTTIDNATKIDSSALFNPQKELNTDDIFEQFEFLRLSNDPGTRKLINFIDEAHKNFIDNNTIGRYLDRNTFIEQLILVINNLYGEKGSDCLNADVIKNLNNDNTFARLDSIVKSKAFERACIIGINGNVEDFEQGHTGDCWMLSAVNSLRATDAGQKMLNQAITWADDYSSVTVYFAGEKKYITLSFDEIQKAINSGKYARGDKDVLILELAMEKLYGDINGGIKQIKYNQFYDLFVDKTGKDSKMGKGLDDFFNTLGGVLGIGGGKVDLGNGDVKKFLQKLLNTKNSGGNFAATMSLFSSGKSNYKWTTVDGEECSFSLDAADLQMLMGMYFPL